MCNISGLLSVLSQPQLQNMKVTWFLLIAVSTSVASVKININKASDLQLKVMNALARKAGQTTTSIPASSINRSISYSEGTLIGLDSMVRTGNCSADVHFTWSHFEIRFGYKLLAATFANINVHGEDMSAIFRIRDNSLLLAFTVHIFPTCNVTLDEMQYERIAKIDLATSNPAYDGLDVEEFFQAEVFPKMNQILNDDRAEVEESLQFMCSLMPHSQLLELADREII